MGPPRRKVGGGFQATLPVRRPPRSRPRPFRLHGRWLRLGWWVNMQRNNYAKGTLDADRERRLQELPGWTWDTRVDQWEEGFNRLLDYVERHGDARVPQSYTVDGYKLGQWVTTQRQSHRKGTLHRPRTPTPGPARLDMGPHRRPVGGRVQPTPSTTSNATVTPASRGPTRSTATGSVRGSTANAPLTPKALWTPIANADSRTCRAGHGTPTPTSGRRVSADSWTTSNTTVTPASRGPTPSMATRSVVGHYPTPKPHKRHAGRRPRTPTPRPARLDMEGIVVDLGSGLSHGLYVKCHPRMIAAS